MEQNPDYRQRLLEQERSWQLFRKSGQGFPQRATYEVPVVVHLVHNNGPENISDQQVSQAIAFLNDAFANRGYAGLR